MELDVLWDRGRRWPSAFSSSARRSARGISGMPRSRRNAPWMPLLLLDSLLWRQFAKWRERKNNFPGGVVVLSNVRGSQGRHPREPHSVLDDVVDFAVS